MSAAPLVAVLVGTDHHPFDRLLSWVSDLASSGSVRCFVQHGFTTLPPGLDGRSMLDPDDLHRLLLDADAVVTHGGPGMIMDARALGHRPIVVARNPLLGEHVDDHQQRFLRFVAPRDLVIGVDTLPDLKRAVTTAVATGHHLSASADASARASARFTSLVDDLVHHP
ncbi:glycosyltransferase [Nocardioides sp.]|uniref:glycosyltransferase n=1 Tax=Nocardioides sp. TaxID=35761 RepID=UPI002B268F28|nr:glycosyltransferase [Nocardioides sp.]